MNQLINEVETPVWLQKLQWLNDPVSYLENNYQKYGDMFTSKMLGGGIIISNPQVTQEIFTTQANNFDSGITNGLLRNFLGSESVISLDGKPLKQRRKLLMPPFHGERLQTYSQLICDISHNLINQRPKDQPFMMRPMMQELTLEIMIQIIFGLSEGKLYQQLKHLVSKWLEITGSSVMISFIFFRFLRKDWITWSPWVQMKQIRQEICELLQAEIETRRNEGKLDGEDVLTLLLLARDEEGNPMTNTELQDELMTLFFAGVESTSASLTWAFYWTHKLPEIKEKLLQEIDNFEDNNDPMKIAKLPYLTAICQETIRKNPPAMFAFGRVAKSPVEIAGQQYPAKTTFSSCIYLTHHREDLYPNPKEFRPERFLERNYSPYEYFPFGGGNRRCIGYALAQLELKLALATIVRNYHLELAETKPVKAIRRTGGLAPERDIKMIMRGPRSTSRANVTELVGT